MEDKPYTVGVADGRNESWPDEKKGSPVAEASLGIPINPSGHQQELDRNFNLLSICGLAVTSGNAWIALGGSVTVAIYNGGPPGATLCVG